MLSTGSLKDAPLLASSDSDIFALVAANGRAKQAMQQRGVREIGLHISSIRKQPMSAIERAHVIVDPRDNVTTVLDQDTGLRRLQGGMDVAPGIPFGHKVALRPIACGEPVIKYGVAIGRATSDVASDEHVHVHNCV